MDVQLKKFFHWFLAFTIINILTLNTESKKTMSKIQFVPVTDHLTYTNVQAKAINEKEHTFDSITVFDETLPFPPINNLRQTAQIAQNNQTVDNTNIFDLSASRNKSSNLDSLSTERKDDQLPDPILDDFAAAKLKHEDNINALPIFLTEPESVYVVKSRPATLKCKAAHALKLHIKCSGNTQPASVNDQHVDPHSGVHLEEVTATIDRDLLDEYFGEGPFKCECHAWSTRGVITKSQAATINIAYLRKQFMFSPTSLKVKIGSSAELRCVPPFGFPAPKVTWYKNNNAITDTDRVKIYNAETLTFLEVTLQDMANYSCVAENVAGKRTSDSALLIVYANGGWSAWSSWKECKCPGQASLGKKRYRTCTNPVPMNGGSICNGAQIQKTADCAPCSDIVEDTYTESLDRLDFLSNKQYFDWKFYLVIATVVFIFFSLVWMFVICSKRGISSPHYSMAETVTSKEQSYMHCTEKKPMRMHMETCNINYDYATTERMSIGAGDFCGSTSEHHYDVPTVPPNYTNPIDELSIDYRSSSSDSSTEDTSHSTYNTNAKSLLRTETVGSAGGILKLCNGDIILYIPELAISKSSNKNITLKLLNNDSAKISLPIAKSMLICSTFVQTTPRNCNLLKPAILKIPHCLIDPDAWNVSIYFADSDHEDLNASWRKIFSMGEETINTPVFLHLEHNYVYIMTEQLGYFVVVAEPKTCISTAQTAAAAAVTTVFASLKMRLIAYSQFTPSSENYSLRIYVVKDFPNSIDICSSIESQLGGTFMGQSDAFAFYLSSQDLKIRIRYDLTAQQSAAADNGEHIIPYNHVISSNSTLHCEFILKRNFESNIDALRLFIDFEQIGDARDCHSFSISTQYCTPIASGSNRQTNTKVYIDDDGNYVNDIAMEDSFRLPAATKRLICAALDPPRKDERDWRQLAKNLKTNHYIAYFATKSSPTEQILNLWECLTTSPTHNFLELVMALKNLNRPDVVDIIGDHVGPMWI